MRSETQRQLTSGGMSHHDCLRRVQFVALGDLGEVAITVADILERARPPAAWVAHAPILHVPGRESFGGECGAEVPGMIQVVFRAPETTVNVHYHGPWDSRFSITTFRD